jgi:hypothetical protein
MINRVLLAANLALILAVMHPNKPASVTVTDLNVVDANGVVRLRISGDLPGKVNGKKRDLAGLLWYDKTGRERGSHVTDADNRIFLSLDGNEPENALFVSEPDGSTVLRLWRGREVIDLRADEDGSRVSVLRGGKVAFQQPPIANVQTTEVCKAFREARGKFTEAQVLDFCRDRFTEDACRACLGLP